MASVLITSERQEPLATLLLERGLDSIHCAFVSSVGTREEPPVISPDCVLVTSSAVARFTPNLLDHIGQARVVAVGNTTATALASIGVTVHAVGETGGVEAFRRLGLKEHEVGWYVGAEAPSAALNQLLVGSAIHRWSVYRTVLIEPADFDEVGSADVVCFTSGSAVRSYGQTVGISHCPVAVLGATTAGVARELGMGVDAVAERPTLESLADAVLGLL